MAVAAATDFPHVDNPLQDFVLVQGSSSNRLPLLHATRVWRRQVPVRCFFAINDSSLVAALNADPIAQQLNEHYAYYPDLTWAVPNPGTRRVAVSALLAHKHFWDTYKWMMYGDDDTQFYLTSAQRLVAQLDPDQPIALSDNYWYNSFHPHPQAPRCLPCHFNTSLLINNTVTFAEDNYIPRPACPFCIRDFACSRYNDTQLCSDRHDAVLREVYSPRFLGGLRHQAEVKAQADGVKGNETARREEVRRFNANYAAWYRVSREETPGTQQHLPGTFGAAVYGKAWMSTALPFPFCVRHDARVHVNNDTERQSNQCNFPIFHGGAGAVFSVGLMLALDLDAAESFIAANLGEGDSLLSRAISYQGFGFTDPGLRYRIPRAIVHHYQLFHSLALQELVSEMAFLECQQGAALRTTALAIPPAERMWLLEHTVAMHASVHNRKLEEVVAEISQRAETHRALLALAASLKEDPRVRSRNMTLWHAMREVVCARPRPPPPPGPPPAPPSPVPSPPPPPPP